MSDLSLPRYSALARSHHAGDCHKMAVALWLDYQDAGDDAWRVMTGEGRRGQHWWLESETTAADPKHGVVAPRDEYWRRAGVRQVREDPPRDFACRFVSRLAAR